MHHPPTGERPYTCHICGKEFCRKITLTKHVNREHFGKKTKASRKPKRSGAASNTQQVPATPQAAPGFRYVTEEEYSDAIEANGGMTPPGLIVLPQDEYEEMMYGDEQEDDAEGDEEFQDGQQYYAQPHFAVGEFAGLGINMGHGHQQALHQHLQPGAMQHPQSQSGHSHYNPRTHVHGDLIANYHCADVFLSPGIPASEPSSYFTHLAQLQGDGDSERPPSSNSNHSAFSAPPILQHDQQIVYTTPEGVPLVPLTYAHPTEQHRYSGMPAPAGSASGLQQDSPVSPCKVKSSPAPVLVQHAYPPPVGHHYVASGSAVYQSGPGQHVVTSAPSTSAGVPTMTITYAPAHQQAFQPHEAASTGHHAEGYHYMHAQPHQQEQRPHTAFVPQGMHGQHAHMAGSMEHFYPTPPTSSQPHFVAQFQGPTPSLLAVDEATQADASAPKMYLSASHPGFAQMQHYGAVGTETSDDASAQSGQHHAQQHTASGAPAAYYASPSPPPSNKYLIAPPLARSISSPIMPLRYMPPTPAMHSTPTFGNMYLGGDDVKPQIQYISGADI